MMVCTREIFRQFIVNHTASASWTKLCFCQSRSLFVPICCFITGGAFNDSLYCLGYKYTQTEATMRMDHRRTPDFYSCLLSLAGGVCISWEICGEIATTGDIFYSSWASHYSELFYRWLAHKLAHWAKTLWTIFTGWWWLDRRVARRGGVITQYLLWLLTRTTYIFSPAFLKSSLKWSEGATIVLHRHDRGVASNWLTMSTRNKTEIIPSIASIHHYSMAALIRVEIMSFASDWLLTGHGHYWETCLMQWSDNHTGKNVTHDNGNNIANPSRPVMRYKLDTYWLISPAMH